jgi:hypothetical protein
LFWSYYIRYKKGKILMRINTVSTDAFLENLSLQDGKLFYGYNNGFLIDQSKDKGFVIQEISKEWYNPFRLHLEDKKKIETAQNLKNLIVKKAGDIARDSRCNTNQIIKVLNRYKMLFISGMEDSRGVSASFDTAVNKLSSNQILNLNSKIRWNPVDFLKKLGETSMMGRPNFHFYFYKGGKTGALIPYTSLKPWFFEKFFQQKASDESEKLTQIQNLKWFISLYSATIVKQRLNAVGIQENITCLANRMKTNMSSEGQEHISQCVDVISKELEESQKAISSSCYSNFEWSVWQGAYLTSTLIASSIFGYIVNPDSLLSYLSNPMVACATAGMFLSRRWVLYPAGKYAGKAVMACIGPTPPYRWLTVAGRGVAYGGSFIPWGVKGVCSGAAAFASKATELLSSSMQVVT